MIRFWTCGGCKTRHPRTKQKCTCGRKRPKATPPKHRAVLDNPYEWWVERFGEACGICGAGPSATRRLDRDHDHESGAARGLLCHRCNRTLGRGITLDWCRRAVEYLERSVREPGYGPENATREES